MRLFLFLFLPVMLSAQIPVAIQSDSTVIGHNTLALEKAAISIDSLDVLLATTDSSKYLNQRIKNFIKAYPNPNHALLSGLFFPGGGQFYNGSLWKIPLIYGGYGTVIYFISTNNRAFKFWEQQHYLMINDRGNPAFELGDTFTDTDRVKFIRDEYRRRRDYSWLALVGVSIISIADAFVNCHLKKFNISDDLTFQLKPVLTNTPGWGRNAGLGCSVPIR